ncbi:MAG: bifunctional phosphoribosylaminoimidazolecarboxamide formyltransferase/IMP cyclohydrolase [Candidatus Aminicenantes bacterium]|nr:bifunctional phosphoribosylaminoimidazolecarboxamide formyltransferase/IMP cyclohydrolase [Candidatus Aminicenantes bacterium]
MSSNKRALISVFHKENIEIAAKKLKRNGWEIISTGGTAKHLQKHDIPVTEVSEITGFPEILDGRVKTLHPKIFGPVLAKNSSQHLEQLKQHSLSKIDLVIVNFYPFEAALQKKEQGMDFMIENIDIGGPSMVRAAAKNFRDTIVIVDREDYLPVVDTLVQKDDLSPEQKKELAGKAFSYTSFYDSLIAGYFNEDMEKNPPYMNFAGRKAQELRYGENPHQKAALYIRDKNSPLYDFEKLAGKELSFNNILDLSMVYETLNWFKEDNFCVIVKHQNPCGAATAASQKKAFEKAFAGDSKSAFGGIVGFNKTLDGETAEKMKKIFFEVIAAPGFTKEALDCFKKKKNLRIIKISLGYWENIDVKTVPGGFVCQERDNEIADPAGFALKTSRSLSENEKKDVDFGWKLIRFVKSNGIIIVKDGMLTGVGAGQMSRVDAVELSIKKGAAPHTHEGAGKGLSDRIEGAVLLSDAFFPFADSIEIAAQHKIAVVVEPGGSVRDEEVIAAAGKHNISLLFTGMRHFRH